VKKAEIIINKKRLSHKFYSGLISEFTASIFKETKPFLIQVEKIDL
jgi:hypothetical protein